MSSNCDIPGVVGLGSPILDLLAMVDDRFVAEVAGGGKGGMAMVESDGIDRLAAAAAAASRAPATTAPGGSAANTIMAMARLGSPASLIGAIGRDRPGETYTALYLDTGASDASLKRKGGAPSGRCLSLITPDTQRTMRTCLGAAAMLSPSDLVPADFEGRRHLHVEGYMLFNEPVLAKALEMAAAAGLTVSLDLASFEVVTLFRDKLPGLIARHVDILFANEDEAMAYAGSRRPEDIFPHLEGKCGLVALKLGAAGAVIRSGDMTFKAPAKPAKAVDTTGAGDLWQAGFLHAHLSGAHMDKVCDLAAAMGAEAVSVVGAALPADAWGRILARCR